MANSKMDDLLSCADFLKKYSGDPRLIPLSQIAVHPLNRKGAPLSGQQVKDLLKGWDSGSKAGEEGQHVPEELERPAISYFP